MKKHPFPRKTGLWTKKKKLPEVNFLDQWLINIKISSNLQCIEGLYDTDLHLGTEYIS